MLIQKTVINKYKKALPQEATALAWSAFQAYFLNTDIQQNILQSKEEQFQEGFLRELFADILKNNPVAFRNTPSRTRFRYKQGTVPRSQRTNKGCLFT